MESAGSETPEIAATDQPTQIGEDVVTDRPRRRRIQIRPETLFPLSVCLFVATCLSTWYTGTTFHGWDNLQAFTYAAAVMGILLAHEFGHYFQTLRYRVPASPPLFLPVPGTPFGTMGAVILQGAGYAHRRALFDIAISGPLAGLVIALPVAWWGLQDSRVELIPPNAQALLFGDPLVLQWLIELRHGPLEAGQEVVLTPLLFAGWVGIFVTALNLLPVGQLDGGHILYSLVGKKAHFVAIALIIGAAGWMYFTGSWGYSIFLVLIVLFGPIHPPSADDTVPLGPVRTILGWLTLAFLLIGFTPSPIEIQMPTERPAQSSGEELRDETGDTAQESSIHFISRS